MPGSGRIIALSSDRTVGNLPYGASKAALDRITLAAAHEVRATPHPLPLRGTSHVEDPGQVAVEYVIQPTRWAAPGG